MRLYLVLGLSALAAAGPIPSYSNDTMKSGTVPSMPANITLTFDPVATLNKLKTIYDSLNETEHDAIPNLKSDFLTWLDDTFGTSGLHRRSTPANVTLDPESIQALTKLKEICDSYNGTDHNVPMKVKRDFLEGFADIYNSLPSRPRSTDSTSMPDDESDPLAAWTKTQAVSDSLNMKRMEGGLEEKRDFTEIVKEAWHWFGDAFKSPGLHARSTAINDSRDGTDHKLSLKLKRGDMSGYGSLAESTDSASISENDDLNPRRNEKRNVKQDIKEAWDSFWAIFKAGPYHS